MRPIPKIEFFSRMFFFRTKRAPLFFYFLFSSSYSFFLHPFDSIFLHIPRIYWLFLVFVAFTKDYPIRKKNCCRWNSIFEHYLSTTFIEAKFCCSTSTISTTHEPFQLKCRLSKSQRMFWDDFIIVCYSMAYIGIAFGSNDFEEWTIEVSYLITSTVKMSPLSSVVQTSNLHSREVNSVVSLKKYRFYRKLILCVMRREMFIFKRLRSRVRILCFVRME